ncbi:MULTISPECIES: FHIPEP family type III secretion protein [Burkholderia]|uniref:FHIPEP family type III secretion protein n=1 Tax=Burkholderia anthinoferrum TaxID=3090833 RepID=A0ABU5WPM9_9BURK|nr:MULTISPECIES: FHIPEP family type III secretion protein [Burkholderia]MEB2504150.1 FHIPEP family type III secretion protein [Burkholderia anthinoferrum]MEB2530363.1 FHIPEP family type III secretion protein [Burkholderia anthinoferrum]MEB2562905.1 FHIPEP family type III secretion protein [Burkholderia anthinoferrum]MEB2580308.1 FHIPEP family type III secretion protein [Burkholderia anthinoferrum]KVE07667.1 hypersensitivity response secretion protein hrcV [Burkholderia anthina]
MFKTMKLPGIGEAGIAVLLIAIVSLMILPLPPAIIDGLLAINITISITLLMVTMYVGHIATLSAFPSVLLFTTLFRLSLNIASTKSILLHADAGEIIESFGQLVVGGNLVVGLVVFVIISVVQFIVIAKGSERVAEVGARFTLDALPGKQMSIDADLRANILTPDEARRKRARLAIESQLHGGMDGAMKFVKGDAIAGLMITMINIVAGIAVGVAYHGMSAGEAANRFSVLSIGDAMVSQIPSLLISVAAGVMITRVDEGGDHGNSSLGEDIRRQFTSSARALFFAALLLLGFAAVPGFPAALFALLAGLLGFVGYRLQKKQDGPAKGAGKPVGALQRAGAKGDAPSILPRPPQFTCPLGVRLAADVSARLAADALDRAFDAQRHALQSAVGLPFPGIMMWTDGTLPEDSYEVLLFDVPQGRTTLAETRAVHAAADGGAADAPAAAATPEALIARHTIDLLRRNAHLFLGIQEAQWMLDQLNEDYPGLVAEVQKALPLQKMADVLRRLLEEEVPVRNIRSITESLIVWGPKEKDMLMLTEYIRMELGRLIAYRATGGVRDLPVVLVDVQVEQHIRQSIKQTPTGNFLALPPDEIAQLVGKIADIVGDTPRQPLALVASMDIRRYIKRMIEARLPWLPVYSYQELGSHVDLQPVGRLAM